MAINDTSSSLCFALAFENVPPFGAMPPSLPSTDHSNHWSHSMSTPSCQASPPVPTIHASLPGQLSPAQSKPDIRGIDTVKAKPTRRSKTRKGAGIPRPSNSFILFRTDFVNKHAGPQLQQVLSKLAGEKWANLPDDERAHWDTQAAEALKQHMLKYPDYRYSPRRKSSCQQKAAPKADIKKAGMHKRFRRERSTYTHRLRVESSRGPTNGSLSGFDDDDALSAALFNASLYSPGPFLSASIHPSLPPLALPFPPPFAMQRSFSPSLLQSSFLQPIDLSFAPSGMNAAHDTATFCAAVPSGHSSAPATANFNCFSAANIAPAAASFGDADLSTPPLPQFTIDDQLAYQMNVLGLQPPPQSQYFSPSHSPLSDMVYRLTETIADQAKANIVPAAPGFYHARRPSTFSSTY